MPNIKPMDAQLELMCELNAGRKSGEEEGWISANDVRNHFKNKKETSRLLGIRILQN